MASIIKRGTNYRALIRLRGQSVSGTFDTRAEAQAWADKTEDRIRAGVRVNAKGGTTVADLFGRYSEEVSPTKRGERWEVIRLGALQRTADFDVPADTFDGAALAAWRDRRLREVSAATVNRDLNLISAVFSRAMLEWRLPLTRNPVRDMQRPAQPHARTRRVSDAERDAIVAELTWTGERPADLLQWTAWAFLFALETAMRQGEIVGMTWRHVHERSIHLPKTKNGHPRDVPLSSGARALLGLLDRGIPDQRVVSLSAGTCGAYFREAVRNAGIDDLHFHDARHEAITRMAARLSIMELARVSGHRDTRMLLAYYHPDAGELAAKLD